MATRDKYDSFNRSHCLAYSLVALQEMNLAFKYPIVFWNCACLITDSGGSNNEDMEESNEEIVDIYESEDFEEYEYIDAPDKKTKIKKKRQKTNDYKKIATAISKMKQSGIEVLPPDINNSSYTFTPDPINNKILFGLSGMLNVGEDIILDTINNRPYESVKDYYLKVNPKKPAMISLIKGGAFDSMMDRKLCMAWYIWETCDKKTRLTLQNMNGLIKYDLLPKDTEERIMALRVYEFNRYLKAVCKYDNEYYLVDERAINFLTELGYEEYLDTDNIKWYLGIKKWDKIYQKWMDIFRTWINENKEQILNDLNKIIFKEDWEKYALGSISAWEMEALCYYYHDHELINVNTSRYGFSDFYKLPEEPEVEKTFKKSGKEIRMFKLSRICGTCIAKNDKGNVTILTTSGVVEVKFRKEYYSLFNRRISQVQADGSKKVIERSWFNRGNMIVVTGIRSGDYFIAKKYASTPGGHMLYRIKEIINDGRELRMTSERYQGGIEEDEPN